MTHRLLPEVHLSGKFLMIHALQNFLSIEEKLHASEKPVQVKCGMPHVYSVDLRRPAIRDMLWGMH